MEERKMIDTHRLRKRPSYIRCYIYFDLVTVIYRYSQKTSPSHRSEAKARWLHLLPHRFTGALGLGPPLPCPPQSTSDIHHFKALSLELHILTLKTPRIRASRGSSKVTQLCYSAIPCTYKLIFTHVASMYRGFTVSQLLITGDV